MMDLNAKTVFLMSREVIPAMLEQQSGKIINIGARAALQGSAKMGPYVASKMAVIRLTESMAAELKGSHINVNCILPGTIDTPANRKSMPDADFSRWVAPESLAGCHRILASDAARGCARGGRSRLWPELLTTGRPSLDRLNSSMVSEIGVLRPRQRRATFSGLSF
ncbi:MAG: SDR family NAD(P)-dependent oxidoreductase [Chloroflexota bacterium]